MLVTQMANIHYRFLNWNKLEWSGTVVIENIDTSDFSWIFSSVVKQFLKDGLVCEQNYTENSSK